MKKLVKSLEYAKGVGVFMMVSLLVAACSQLDVEPTQPGDDLRLLVLSATCSGPTVAPITDLTGPGGNVECSQAGEYEFSSGRLSYNDGQFGIEEGEGDDKIFTPKDWPEGFTIHTDGTFVSWEFTPFEKDGVLQCLKDLSVIVKGGDAANVYTYSNGETSDCDLVSPDNASGGPAGLSNLTLCYNLEPCEDEPCFEFEGETAWSAGTRYVTRGNWATYTAYDGDPISVTLFAGQTLDAGTVSFSLPDADGMVEITITLNEGWGFVEDDENVKIQDYAVAPSGNPSPGGFEYKGQGMGSTFSIDVPENNFYGVHVDVGQLIEVECEEEIVE